MRGIGRVAARPSHERCKGRALDAKPRITLAESPLGSVASRRVPRRNAGAPAKLGAATTKRLEWPAASIARSKLRPTRLV